MASSLTVDQRASVRQSFLALDASDTGSVTVTDLQRILKEKGHIQEGDEGLASDLFHILDASDDHRVDYNEFLAAAAASRVMRNQDVILQVFDRFDVDGTGQYFTPENLQSLLGDALDKETMAEIVNDVDTNKDGKIDKKEFIEYLTRSNAPVAHEASQGLLPHIDKHLNEP